VIGAYRNVEGIQIEQETGAKPLAVPLDEVGVPTYDELVLVANAPRLEADAAYAAAVEQVVAALAEGTEGAIADPERALAIMDESTDYEPAFLAASVPATLALLSADGRPTGCFELDDWERFRDWMLATGLLEVRVDVSLVVTNDYHPGC
jgi:putative hydroxymethylpyrimidine transport system substrate-binding protein